MRSLWSIMRPLIGYVRVSTAKRGKSGLGIEAQQEALTRFAQAEGFELVRLFVEVETGKGSDALERRPQLAAALAGASSRRRQSTVMSPSVSTVAMLCLQPMCLFQMAKKSPVAAERVWAAFQLPRPEA